MSTLCKDYHLADGLGGPSRAGNDVLRGSASSSPVLAAGPVHRLLGGGGGVHGGHQTLQDPEVVVDNLGQRRQTVGGAGGVRHNLEDSKFEIEQDKTSTK